METSVEASIEPFDWQRMLFGDSDPLFLAEIAVRTLLLYLFALAMVRLMGKRGMAQLTPFEFVIIVALGSAVGDPMFYPDVPLVHGFVVIASVVLLQQGLSVIARRWPKLDEVVEGRPTVAVRQGVIQHDAVEAGMFSLAEVLEMMRLQGIARLEDVELAVIENAGRLSVLRRSDATGGISPELWATDAIGGHG
jgi:uncharacterized membrane protein YcaP (DUF421 family)